MSAAPKIVYFTSSAPPLSPEDLHGILSALGRDSKIWAALRQLLQERSAAAMMAVADSRLKADERAHAAGRLDEILGLVGEIATHIEG